MSRVNPRRSSIRFAQVKRTVVATAPAIFLMTAVALAQTAQDKNDCLGRDNASYDQIIAGFTSVIRLGRLTGQEFAAAHFSRGMDYSLKTQPDLAIQDLDQVLKLTPDDATAFDERGAAY